MRQSHILFTIFIIMLTATGAARAQNCVAEYELIFQMNDPVIGSFSIWDAVYGQKNKAMRFKTGLSIDAEHTLAVGESVDDADQTHTPQVLLVMLDKRGRVAWEKTQAVAGLSAVKKVIAHPDGFLVMADRAMPDIPGDIWLGFFDAQGTLTSEQIVDTPEGPVNAHDIVPGFNAGEYLVAASFRKGDGKIANSLLLSLDRGGNVLWRRAYMPGIDNKIFGLSLIAPNKLAATGYIQTTDGRRAGWLMLLTRKGSIDWQLQYPRGRAAQFYKVAPFKKSYLAAAGTAYPSGGGPLTSLMAISSGSVITRARWISRRGISSCMIRACFP